MSGFFIDFMNNKIRSKVMLNMRTIYLILQIVKTPIDMIDVVDEDDDSMIGYYHYSGVLIPFYLISYGEKVQIEFDFTSTNLPIEFLPEEAEVEKYFLRDYENMITVISERQIKISMQVPKSEIDPIQALFTMPLSFN